MSQAKLPEIMHLERQIRYNRQRLMSKYGVEVGMLRAIHELLRTSTDEEILMIPTTPHIRTLQIGEEDTSPSVDDKIAMLTNRCSELELQVSELKHRSGAPPYREAANLAGRVFSGMRAVTGVSYRKAVSGMTLIIVHEADNITDVLDQIQEGVARLEEEFPDMHYEPWVLNTTEVQKEHIQHSTVIC